MTGHYQESKKTAHSMGKILTNHLFNKSLVSRIYEELLQCNNKMTNIPVKKMDEGYEQTLLQRSI